MINDSFEVLQQPRIQQRIASVNAMEDEAKQLVLIKKLFLEIQGASKSIVDEIGSGVAITNLDEVTTALHNETTRNGHLLLAALKDLKLSGEKQSKILSEVMKDAQVRLEEEFQTIRIKRPLDKVHVLNPQDFPIAEEVDITNWPAFEAMFKSLEKALKDSLNINLPAPQVTIEAPVVHVPPQSITIPEADFEPLINELKRGLTKLRTNNKSNPMFVRVSDFERMIEVLEEVREASRNVMLGFPGIIGLRGVGGGLADPNTFGSTVSLIASTLGDGNKTVATAGTRVQLVSVATPCKWVVVTAKSANAGAIYIGGTTIATGRGKQLVSLQETEVKVNDVSKIWMDADTNGDGCIFYYGS